MSGITEGEKLKMELLGGALQPGDFIDTLLEGRVVMGEQQMLDVLMPVAELRAQQIERGQHSNEPDTRAEAERTHQRYTNLANAAEAGLSEHRAHQSVQERGGDASLAQKIAGDWLGKEASNRLVGEMEKELQRTVNSYRAEKQEGVLRMSHSVAMGR